MRFGWSVFGNAALLLLALCFAAASAEARAWDPSSSLRSAPAPPGLTFVWNEADEAPASAMDRLQRAGFRIAVAVPPHAFYVLAARDLGRPLPAGFSRLTVPQAAPAPVSDPASGPVGPLRVSLDTPVDPFGGRADVIAPKAPRPDRSGALQAPTLKGLPYGARWDDTSEFMVGRVAVSILFPESDGTLDPNLYDWTPALRDSIVRSAVRGLARWSNFAALRGIPLTFALETKTGLATRYEPIEHPTSEEEFTWIQDCLQPLVGYKADPLTLCYDVANSARASLGAQWAVLIFAVQNDTDPDGHFPDSYFAHSTFGGPYYVIPVNNENTTVNLDFYMEHEMAHTFWALDEHFPSTGWWSCLLQSGYFYVPNSNSVVPAPGYCNYRRGCVMYAFHPDTVCVFTAGQIGWVDRDASGKIDLLETGTSLVPDSTEYHGLAGQGFTLRGYAAEVMLPNLNLDQYAGRDTMTIATVDSVLYRIDSGPLILALPTDGAYDSGKEFFSASIPPLAAGDYTVQWEAWNSNGLVAHAGTLLFISGSSAPPTAGDGGPLATGPVLRAGPTPSSGTIRFSLRGGAGAVASAAIYDVQGRMRWRRDIPLGASGLAEWTWDARVPGGGPLPSGLYFLNVQMQGATLNRRLVLSR